MKQSKAQQIFDKWTWSGSMNPWVIQAQKAFDQGYYFETIAICYNCINVILREGILIVAKGKGESTYLDSLFRDSNTMLDRISDRSIYDEALRIGVITEDIGTELHAIHSQRNRLFHSLFDKFKSGKSETEEKILEELARRYLLVLAHCLLSLTYTSYEKSTDKPEVTRKEFFTELLPSITVPERKREGK